MKCKLTKQNGTQCNANAMIGVEYCFSHNPNTKDKKKKAVIKGGLALKPRKDAKQLEPLPLKSVADIQELIEDTINRVRTEPMTHQKANCIGYLANIALKTLEVGELEERLASVEEQIKDNQNS